MIVLDASAAVELLLGSQAGRHVADRLDSGAELHYPELMPIEAVSAVRGLVRAGVMSVDRGQRAVEHLADLGGARHRHGMLVVPVYRLSSRFSVYDAVYVALAQVLGARLLTTDGRLARQATSLIDVELVA